MNNSITPAAIVRTYCLQPCHGGFCEWQVVPQPSEWAEFGQHFEDKEVIHADDFGDVIEDIRGRIHGEAGRGELYAYLDRGEWTYTLVEVKEESAE